MYYISIYHEIDDYFDMIANKYIIISDDRKTVTRIDNGPCCTCYGKKIISSIIKKEYIWKMIINADTAFLDIGIDNAINPYGITTRFIYRKTDASMHIILLVVFCLHRIMKK